MDQNSLSDIWAEFCFHLSDDISTQINENMFELKVLSNLEKLGWSKRKGEIKVRQPIQLGRQNTIIPDIVMYTPDNKPAVVVEVKRPAENLGRPENHGQLKSYMRQTKSAFGLLIGSGIHVYYDGPLSQHDDLLLLSKISFRSDSGDGINFIDLFNKQSFIDGKYKTYLKAHIDRLEHMQRVASARECLQAEVTSQKVRKFLENELRDVDPCVLSEAMKGMVLNISYLPSEEPFAATLDEKVVSKKIQENIFICKNIKSGKYFIYLDDSDGNDIRLINSDGDQVVRNADLFDQPKEESVDYLQSYGLVTTTQLKKYKEYDLQEATKIFTAGTLMPVQVPTKRLVPNHKSVGGKSPCPSAQEWSRGVPELSGMSGHITWKAICNYLKIDVGVDSARRVLKNWANKNRNGWPMIPEP